MAINTIGNTFTWVKGKKPNVLLESFDEETIPYLSASYLRSGKPDFFTKVSDKNCVRVDNNETVLIWDGSNAGDVFMGIDGALSSTMVKFIKTEKCSSSFLYFLLKENFKLLNGQTTGSTIPHVNGTTLRDIDIPIVNSVIQEKAVEILKTIQSAVNCQKVLLEKLHELKRSTMQHLFTKGVKGEKTKETDIGEIPESWKITEAVNLLEKVNFGTSVKCSENIATYPVLRIPNVVDETLDLTEVKYCEMTDRQASSFLLEAGDLVFVRTNGSRSNIGKNIIFKNELNKCMFASFTIRARFDKSLINPLYVHFYTQFGTGREYLFQSARSSTGKFNLNTQAIKHMLLPLPSIDEQNKLCQIIESVNAKIEFTESKLKTYQDLFKTLLHELMSGERRVI